MMLKEMYRFFILNYVIKDGDRFFHSNLAKRLSKESFDTYIPNIDDDFQENKILDSNGNVSADATHNPTLFVTVDGESCLTTPCSFEFHPNQLIVRGANKIPNE